RGGGADLGHDVRRRAFRGGLALAVVDEGPRTACAGVLPVLHLAARADREQRGEPGTAEQDPAPVHRQVATLRPSPPCAHAHCSLPPQLSKAKLTPDSGTV